MIRTRAFGRVLAHLNGAWLRGYKLMWLASMNVFEKKIND